MPELSAEQRTAWRAKFEAWGPDQLKTLMQTGGLPTTYNVIAIEWLAEKAQEKMRLQAASQTAMAATASRAAAAAEAQARTAKHALTTAIVATVIAAIALIVSIIGFFHLFGR
jgi:hypothetical protein